DGRYQTFARIDAQGILSIRSIPENEEIRRIDTKMKIGAGHLWLSPDGQCVAVLDDSEAVQVWRVAGGKPLLGEALRPCRGDLEFSPDSRQLAVIHDDSVVCIDLASGRETTRWRLPGKAHALAFDKDSRRLAVGYADNKVVSIYDFAHGSHLADLPVGLMSIAVVAWHPDGTRLAVAGSDPSMQIWDVAAKRKLATVEGHAQPVFRLSFYPDCGLLASASWEGVLRLWDPATGRQLMQLPCGVALLRFDST